MTVTESGSNGTGGTVWSTGESAEQNELKTVVTSNSSRDNQILGVKRKQKPPWCENFKRPVERQSFLGGNFRGKGNSQE